MAMLSPKELNESLSKLEMYRTTLLGELSKQGYEFEAIKELQRVLNEVNERITDINYLLNQCENNSAIKYLQPSRRKGKFEPIPIPEIQSKKKKKK